MRILLIPIVLGILLVIFAVVGSLSGSLGFSPGGAESGGVFKSIDGGRTFSLQSDVPDTDDVSLDKGVVQLEQADSSTLYAATSTQGLFRSSNSASSWELIFTGEVTTSTFGVNPKDQNEVYIGALYDRKARIYKTSSGSTDWTEVYLEPRDGARFVSVRVDQSDSSVVYALLSNGVLLKSFNRGQDWILASNLSASALELIIDPQNTQVMYVLTPTTLFRSTDAGFSFESIQPQLEVRGFNATAEISSFAINPNNSNELYVGSASQMVRSNDAGATWESVPILTPDANVVVRAISVNPSNSDIIHYTAGAVFYTSRNRGQSWNTAQLPPEVSMVTEILVDRRNGDIIYIGAN